MTGCMIINPTIFGERSETGTPILLADTMVTFDKLADKPSIIPANVSNGDFGQVSKVALYRKLYVLQDRFAVAFSSDDGPQIEACLDDLSGRLPVWLRTERPMQKLEELVHERYPDIRVVGGSLDPATRSLNHIAPNANVIRRRALGFTAAIGSGREAMEAMAQHFEELPGVADLPALARGVSFATSMIGTTLVREIFGDVRDWGGYFEFVGVAGNRWVHAPRTLHLVIALVDIGGNKFRPHLLPRAIAYDPGHLDGRILALQAGGSAADFAARDYLVENRLEKAAGREIATSEQQWIGWRPQSVMVSIAYERENDFRSIHDVLTGERLQGAIFQIEPRSVQFGLAPELLVELAQFGAAGLGVELA